VRKTVGPTTTDYVWAGFDVLNDYQNGAVKASYLLAGELGPVALEADGSLKFYHKDGLFSTLELRDGSGTLVHSYRYDEFGVITVEQGSAYNSYTYTGQHRDLETALYYLRARNYSPDAGRFLSRDPYPGRLPEPVTLHLYVYCMNSPTNRMDPLGLDPGVPYDSRDTAAYDALLEADSWSRYYGREAGTIVYLASDGNWYYVPLVFASSSDATHLSGVALQRLQAYLGDLAKKGARKVCLAHSHLSGGVLGASPDDVNWARHNGVNTVFTVTPGGDMYFWENDGKMAPPGNPFRR
jgi:RHS repeat-associated protein